MQHSGADEPDRRPTRRESLVAAGLADPAQAGLSLRLLATTDLHGHLAGYDYFEDRPCIETGLARLASLIGTARAEAVNTLLLDNGDFLQGSPLVDYWARERGLSPGEVHPMIAAMNALCYDAVTVGNHEFNFGLDFTLRALDGAAFPVVSANAVQREGASPAEDETLFAPWVILERDLADAAGQARRLRIGVIGFLPPQTVLWDRALLSGLMSTRGIAEAARAHVPALRAAGADIVVALAPTGIAPEIAPDTPEHEIEDAALPLAEVEGIDVIVCGHTHALFPAPGLPPAPGLDPMRGTLCGKPAVLPGRWGSHLGVVDLHLVPRAAGGWQVRDFDVGLRAVAERAPDAQIRALVEEDPQLRAVSHPAHIETLHYIRRELGQLATPLHSFFSLVAPDAGLSLIAGAQATTVAERLVGRPEAALPLLSAVAPMRCGGRGGPNYYLDLPPGPVRQQTIASLYIFPNTVKAVKVTGAALADWLERAAGVFRQIRPGMADQGLLDPAFPCYNFDVIAGLSYEIDISCPARFGPDGSLAHAEAHRIRALSYEGEPVDPAAEFVVATNNYRNSGAGGFVEAAAPALELGPEITSHEMLAELARSTPVLAPVAEQIWRFAPIAGASALFETSPQAAGQIGCAEGLQMEEIGLTEAGFLQIRIHF